MVKVRLARRGSKKRPFYHLIVTDSENWRDGRFIEQVGTYDPDKELGDATVNLERIEYWLSTGAQLTERAGHIVKAARKQAADQTAASA